eukprot:SAG31_NODE_1483_length_8166_cov_5.059874_3_plen_96_part_00
MCLGVGLSFLWKTTQEPDGYFKIPEVDRTLTFASFWLVLVCLVTMIFAGLNDLHLPPVFGKIAIAMYGVFCVGAWIVVKTEPVDTAASAHVGSCA